MQPRNQIKKHPTLRRAFLFIWNNFYFHTAILCTPRCVRIRSNWIWRSHTQNFKSGWLYTLALQICCNWFCTRFWQRQIIICTTRTVRMTRHHNSWIIIFIQNFCHRIQNWIKRRIYIRRISFKSYISWHNQTNTIIWFDDLNTSRRQFLT